MQNALFNYVNETVSSNDHFTPKWVFDLLGLEFDIDVAAPVNGVPYIPCKRWFSQADDGLTQDWAGLVWCNPPYSNILPWVKRLNLHRNGVALLPHTKGAWRREIWENADAIVEWSTISEIKFNYNGKDKTIFPTTFLAGWGAVAIKALENVGRVR